MKSQAIFKDRLETIAEFAAMLEQNSESLQEAAALDAGFPFKVTAMEISLAVDYLRTMEEEVCWVENGRPYGTVAAILPYDAPAIMLARLGAAAFLTGNRLRFSFSSQTPRSAVILADVSRRFASLEPVVGQNNREFGRRCVEDPKVRVQFISGASAVGSAYRSQYHAFDKLFFAGPGGMPAAIVFPNADVELASRFIARRAFINGGQYCTTLKKVLIHHSLYEPMRQQILDLVRQLRVGDPMDPATDIGPIRVERTRRILQQALAEVSDARLLAGGIEGEWITPLVLETEDREIPDLELFGPFLMLKPFEDAEAAVQEMILTRYGFLLVFFGTPSPSAEKLFHDHFGMIYDNPDFYFTPLRLPFGGKKESGWILERRDQGWQERDGAFVYSKELAKNGS